jgi:DNA-binding transcriptional regulator YdaS (Cro superfamily)
MDRGLQLAIAAAGSMRKLGDKLGISAQAIQQWKQIPAHQIIAVERVTGIPREKLRPDLYAKPKSSR